MLGICRFTFFFFSSFWHQRKRKLKMSNQITVFLSWMPFLFKILNLFECRILFTTIIFSIETLSMTCVNCVFVYSVWEWHIFQVAMTPGIQNGLRYIVNVCKWWQRTSGKYFKIYSPKTWIYNFSKFTHSLRQRCCLRFIILFRFVYFAITWCRGLFSFDRAPRMLENISTASVSRRREWKRRGG